MSSDVFPYVGQELDVFRHAQRWKKYWASRISPWVKGDVLEVGAGLGGNTLHLQNGNVNSWQCLEPDPELARQLSIVVEQIPSCSVRVGTTASVSARQFDSILYIDVLEHIEADAKELATAAGLLRPQGYLIVLSPAHQFLYTKFDAAIGHYRRYNKTSLRGCSPPGCEVEAIFYLDSVGVLASCANRMLRQSYPTVAQVRTWDNYIVRASKVLDPALRYRVGKTIVGVWRRVGSKQI